MNIKVLTSFKCLIERNDRSSRCANSVNKLNRYIRNHPSYSSKNSNIVVVIIISNYSVLSLLSGMIIELSSAYRTVFASTLNELHNTKPVKRVIAWESPCLVHSFFANSTFFILVIFNKRIVIINVLQESTEFYKFLDFFIKIRG